MIADVRSLSASEYIAAKRLVIRGTHDADRQRRDAADLARLRNRYPDLAKAGDLSVMEDYRARIRALVVADEAMKAAADAKKAAEREPSAYARELAGQRLAAAVETHDTILRDVIARHASLPES